MIDDQNTVPALYKKLLTFYPREFRRLLGASMEQTFIDLWNERKGYPAPGFFILSIFAETAIGIGREHLSQFTGGDSMKNILAKPVSAAITSFVMSLPLGLIFVIFNSDIDALTSPLKSLLTVNGYDINPLGRVVIFGGLFLLPFAFVINLLPMLRKEGSEGKRTPHAFNMIVGLIILLLIAITWGGLILEQIYCLQGIRCD